MLKKRIGRPPRKLAQKKRAHLMRVALDEFVKKGFNGASIDGIAKASGFSRTSIYKLFEDKHGLFWAVVGYTSDSYAAHFVDLKNDDREPGVVLKETAKQMYRYFVQPENLTMLRLCISETASFPELASHARRTMLTHAFTGLRAYFERLHKRGLAHIPDSAAAATLFNVMTIGSLKPLLVNKVRLDRAEETRIEWAVDIFLRGCLRC